MCEKMEVTFINEIHALTCYWVSNLRIKEVLALLISPMMLSVASADLQKDRVTGLVAIHWYEPLLDVSATDIKRFPEGIMVSTESAIKLIDRLLWIQDICTLGTENGTLQCKTTEEPVVATVSSGWFTRLKSASTE